MYMTIDQYGQTYHGLKHPRKELMEELDCRHADKMYINKPDGRVMHIGYVIKGYWLTLYTPYEKEVK